MFCAIEEDFPQRYRVFHHPALGSVVVEYSVPLREIFFNSTEHLPHFLQSYFVAFGRLDSETAKAIGEKKRLTKFQVQFTVETIFKSDILFIFMTLHIAPTLSFFLCFCGSKLFFVVLLLLLLARSPVFNFGSGYVLPINIHQATKATMHLECLYPLLSGNHHRGIPSLWTSSSP